MGLVCCQRWAAPSRPARPVFAQLQDLRKSPESVTETSVVQWIGGASEARSWSNTPPSAADGGWDRADNLHSKGKGRLEIASFKGN